MGQKKSAAQRAKRSVDSGVGLQGVMDGIEDKLLIVDKEYRINFANRAMREVLPESKLVIGKSCYEIFGNQKSPCHPPLWKCPLMEVLESGDPAVIVAPDSALNKEAESNRYVKIILYPLKDSQGNIDAIAELRKDVTVEKELENQILRRHHHLHALNRISSATSGLWDLDAILNIALDTVLEIINATTGGILLLHGQTQKLRATGSIVVCQPNTLSKWK
jgi:transcriptional regulator with PAS, ATPase and Fis domain